MAAERARAFVARFVSDLSRFTTDDASRGLEDVARRSEDTTRGLEGTTRAAEDTGRALDETARGAADTGRDLETTSRASDETSRALGDVRGGAEDATRSLEDAGRASTGAADELSQTTTEAGDASRALGDVRGGAADATAGLGDVDAAAGDARTALGDVAGDADRASGDLDRLGTDTSNTARKLDDAFDRIRAASRSGLRGVGDEADRADDRLSEVGDEGRQVALELGSSFDASTEGIADSFQDIAANALQSFGVVGIAAGVTAAVGIGALRAQAERLREEAGELAGEMIDAGGSLERDSILGKLREFAEDGSIRKLAEQAEAAQVPVEDFLLAVAGDQDALARSRDALDASTQAMLDRRQAALDAAETQTELRDVTAAMVTADGDLRAGQLDVRDALDRSAESYGLATEAVQRYAEAATEADNAGLSADTLDELSGALEGMGDSVGAYTEVLETKNDAERATAEATAAATEDASDSWEDYAESATVSVDEYLAKLTEQVEAQEAWAENMAILAGRVSEDTLAELAKLPPEAAGFLDKLAHESDEKLSQLDDLYARQGAAARGALVAEIDDAAAPAGQAGARAGRATAAEYAEAIGGQSAAVRYRAGKLAQDAAYELERSYHPVITPVLNMTPLRQSLSQELTVRTG